VQGRNLWGMCLAVILLASGVNAQQSGSPSKPAETERESSASPKPATGPPGEEQPSQKVVLKVGATQVTQSEIDGLVSKLSPKARTIVATEGRQPVAEEYVKMLVLSQRALDEHLDSTPALRSELEIQRDQTLAEAEYQKMAGAVKVSPEEVSQYYAARSEDFETVQVREFLVRKRPQGSKDPKQGLTAEEAKAKAELIRKALADGNQVEKVTEDFSDPPRVQMVDARPRTLRRSEMTPALAAATFQVKQEGVSELVDTPQAFVVVKVLKRQHPELKDVTAEIESKIRQEKLDAEIDRMRKDAGVWMDEEYFHSKPPDTPGSAPRPVIAPGPVAAPPGGQTD
jgi:parvulin-like peptidyl-prolyl isomerase